MFHAMYRFLGIEYCTGEDVKYNYTADQIRTQKQVVFGPVIYKISVIHKVSAFTS